MIKLSNYYLLINLITLFAFTSLYSAIFIIIFLLHKLYLLINRVIGKYMVSFSAIILSISILLRVAYVTMLYYGFQKEDVYIYLVISYILLLVVCSTLLFIVHFSPLRKKFSFKRKEFLLIIWIPFLFMLVSYYLYENISKMMFIAMFGTSIGTTILLMTLLILNPVITKVRYYHRYLNKTYMLGIFLILLEPAIWNISLAIFGEYVAPVFKPVVVLHMVALFLFYTGGILLMYSALLSYSYFRMGGLL